MTPRVLSALLVVASGSACLVVGLPSSACSLRASPSSPSGPDDNEPFELGVGDSVRVKEFEVGFERLLSDSRCPTDVECIWAGDAVVETWIRRGDGPRATFQLHTHPGRGPTEAQHEGRTLVLLDVRPHPVSTTTVSPAEHVVSLKLR